MGKVERLNDAYQYLRSIGKIHTQTDLAKTMNANRVTISNALKDRGGYLNDDFLSRFCRAFDGLFNLDWLLTGEGNMLNEDSPVIDASLSPSKEGVFFTETTSGAKFYDLGNGKYRMTVKLVPYCAYGRFANVHDTLEQDRDDWEEESFEVSQIAHGNYLSFEVKNDSMDDGTRQSFEAGDRLLVRELNRIYWKDKLRYTDHPYWVIAFGSSVLIKQIVSQDMERGVITLHSLNPSPEYSDFELSIDEIQKLYYVIKRTLNR
ncbi:S24 family peptidase [Parabacteroides chongii]|uniref:S24 family peptidase n=1 Tax=Parabacteroides chongii TaxID=2685834 RepID=UPI00240D2BD8|nr:S24 family peptidase [Parabacteroides chongii]WFE85014.1 S24 family peptidase [Parabacteroides chongii]